MQLGAWPEDEKPPGCRRNFVAELHQAVLLVLAVGGASPARDKSPAPKKSCPPPSPQATTQQADPPTTGSSTTRSGSNSGLAGGRQFHEKHNLQHRGAKTRILHTHPPLCTLRTCPSLPRSSAKAAHHLLIGHSARLEALWREETAGVRSSSLRREAPRGSDRGLPNNSSTATTT